jgi:hypothetical protein
MLIHRINIFLLSMIIAFAPAYSFASAAPKLDFLSLTNAIKDGSGFVADYLFKRAANDPAYNAANDEFFEKKAHRSSFLELGKTALPRIVKTTVAGIAIGYGVEYLVTLLKADGWVIDDTDKHEIYKPAGGYLYYVTDRCCDKTKYSSEMAAINSFINVKFPYQDAAQKPVFSNFIGEYPKPLKDMAMNEVQFRSFKLMQPGNPPTYLSYTVAVVRSADAITPITDAEMADYVAKLGIDDLSKLAKSPDYLNEPHAPTIAAAAGAQPKTDKPNNPSTDSSTCPAGTVRDIVNKTCIGADKGVNPRTDGGFELPAFCAWAMPVCDVIEWVKTDPPQQTENTKVDVKERSTSDIKMTPEQFDTDRVMMSAQCPAPVTKSFSFMSQSVPIEFSYQPFCDFMSAIKPAVISGAFFAAAYIIAGANRE